MERTAVAVFISKTCESEKPEVQVNQNLKRFQFCFRRNSASLRRKRSNPQGALIFELPAIFLPLAKKHEAVRLRFMPRRRRFITRRVASYGEAVLHFLA